MATAEIKSEPATYERLCYAITHGDLLAVKTFMTNGSLTKQEIEGDFPWAISKKHLHIVKYMYEFGIRRKYALLNAIEHGTPEIVKYLYENGERTKRALFRAVQNRNLEMVKFLYEQGERDRDALNEATITGCLNIVEYLCEQLDLTFPKPSDFPSLKCAVKSGDVNIVKYLYERGIRDPTCASLAATLGYWKITVYLHAQENKPESPQTISTTKYLEELKQIYEKDLQHGVHIAAGKGDLARVEYLLKWCKVPESGIELDNLCTHFDLLKSFATQGIQFKFAETLNLQIPARGNRDKILLFLKSLVSDPIIHVATEAPIPEEEKIDWWHLTQAAKVGDLSRVKCLHKQGLEIDMVSWWAAYNYGHMHILEYFIECGLKPPWGITLNNMYGDFHLLNVVEANEIEFRFKQEFNLKVNGTKNHALILEFLTSLDT